MRLLNIYNMVIEVTRRCNAKCKHCLRGEAEDMDMQMKYVESLFKKTAFIGTLCFTGGEPSLVPEVLRKILRLAKKYSVAIGSFYIATNAIKISDAFLGACLEWWCYCDDNEMSQVQWSNDPFHKLNEEAVKKLSAFKFASPKYENGILEHQAVVINEGRGAAYGQNRFPSRDVALDNVGDDYVDGDLYLNCKGNIINGCDWSFDSQDEEENIICHVNDLSYEAIAEHLARS